MKTKNLLVFFLVIASLLLVVSTISAATTELATIDDVKIDNLYYELGQEDISVIAGETTTVRVYFTALEDASDVRIEAEIEGEKVDISDKDGPFDVEEGKRYTKTLNLEVPYELKDEVSDDLSLEIKVWNSDYKTEYPEIVLRVQRPSYSADVISLETSSSAEAGEVLPVTVVVKNIGYNYLDDVFVTAKIEALGLEATSYVGDIIEAECDDDDADCDYDDNDEDAVLKRFYLAIPYDAKSGIYTLEVKVQNEDLVENVVKQIVIKNDFSTGNVIATSTRKTFAVGEEVQYNLLVNNPTNKLKVYRIAPESSANLATSVDNGGLVAVPAGSSKTVVVNVKALSEGEQDFSVNIFSGEELVNTVQLGANVEDGVSVGDSIVVITIILAVIFLVLLVILIILLGKKPEQTTEDFGESYY